MRCQRDQFAALAVKERIVDDQKRASAVLQQTCKCPINVVCTARMCDLNL